MDLSVLANQGLAIALVVLGVPYFGRQNKALFAQLTQNHEAEIKRHTEDKKELIGIIEKNTAAFTELKQAIHEANTSRISP